MDQRLVRCRWQRPSGIREELYGNTYTLARAHEPAILDGKREMNSGKGTERGAFEPLIDLRTREPKEKNDVPR